MLKRIRCETKSTRYPLRRHMSIVCCRKSCLHKSATLFIHCVISAHFYQVRSSNHHWLVSIIAAIQFFESSYHATAVTGSETNYYSSGTTRGLPGARGGGFFPAQLQLSRPEQRLLTTFVSSVQSPQVLEVTN